MGELYRTLSRELHEIRLLVIEPAPEDAPVRCRLRHINLKQEPAPPYETISYVWGDPNVRGTIYIAGLERDVPASSERVLRRFRQPHVQRIVWLDAVCINQDDRIERGHQVSVMHAIYGNGRCNLVWLGEDDGSAEHAFAAIDKILNEIQEQTEDYARFFETLYWSNGKEKFSATGLSMDFEWNPLLTFFQSTWFRRLWIVQEASLARHSICYRGKFELPLEQVLKVAQWLRFKRFHLPFDFASQLGVRHTAFIADVMEKHYGLINTDNYEPMKIDFLTLLG